MNWKYLVLIAVGIVIAFFVGRKTGGVETVRTDTISVKGDTVTTVLKGDSVYVPVRVTTKVPVYIPVESKPSSNKDTLLVQYDTLSNKYFSSNYYNDSIPLRDSTGEKVGFLNIKETISKNVIEDRKINYEVQRRTITNTITLSVPEPAKTQVFFGGGLQGSPTNKYGVGADVGFLLKDRKDHIYGINGGFINVAGKTVPQLGVRAYWKLKAK